MKYQCISDFKKALIFNTKEYWQPLQSPRLTQHSNYRGNAEKRTNNKNNSLGVMLNPLGVVLNLLGVKVRLLGVKVRGKCRKRLIFQRLQAFEKVTNI